MSQIEILPVSSKKLRQETGKDIELGPLTKTLREDKDLQGMEAQCSIEDGYIIYFQIFFQRNFRRLFSYSPDISAADVRENNPNIQHAETAEDISKGLDKELGSSSLPDVPSTGVAFPDVSSSSTEVTDLETRSPREKGHFLGVSRESGDLPRDLFFKKGGDVVY
ncbi:hypothetical protein TNCT_242361 [Trichonephila clavata]|uniref:Uncharacterized protein n=1 Tax=Trichonephila clavata TaxID=2740835 RepID=A0A8X6K8G8_TRICU|nr:hypothetical protein TNCT_242361 [Trichonephila clavata]